MNIKLFKRLERLILITTLMLGFTGFQQVGPAKAISPTVGAWTGTTNRGFPMSFTVSGTQWSNFKLKTDFAATNCYNITGTFEITVPGPGTISNRQFSYTSSTYSFTGKFNSVSTASGTYSFKNRQIALGIPFPPYVCYYYFTQSGTWTASVPPPVPGPFSKSNLSNGLVDQSINPTLIWGSSNYADSYEYCIDLSNNNTCDTSWISTGASHSVALLGLSISTPYYWQVRAINPSGTTYAGNETWWSFSTSSIATQLNTFYSLGTNDGWIIESTETSGIGGSMNKAASTLRLGDDASNRQYRAVLSFDTSSMPVSACLTSITLKFKYVGKAGALPFGTHGSLFVDVRNDAFSNNTNLQLGDFKAAASLNKALTFTNSKVDNWYSQSLSRNLCDPWYINLTGVTQFRLRFSKDDNNDFGADYLKIYSGEADVAAQPQLIIEYYLP